MTRQSLLAAALCSALALGACATAPATERGRYDFSGSSSQENWDAGNIGYLNWNRDRAGWTETASGLQYRRVGPARPGGVQPAATDTVKVHYRGTFVDGREFDSSYARNEPVEFPLNRVIKGWTEGVGLMRVGEKYEFVIPATLGYGSRWVGGDDLPPNSTLLFTVELLEVKPAG